MKRRSLLILFSVMVIIGVGVYFWLASQEAKQRELLRSTALELAKKKKFSKAEGDLKIALEHNPQDVEVLAALAQGYMDTSRTSEAAPLLDRWVQAAPEAKQPLELRLQYHRTNLNFPLALADVDRLLALDSSNTALARQRCGFLFNLNRFEEAEALARLILKTEPNDIAAQSLLAQILRSSGKTREAGEILDQIIQSQPKRYPALMSRAILYYENGQPEKAIPLLEMVVAEDPSRKRTGRYHLGIALQIAGKSEEANRVMEEVRKLQSVEVLMVDSENHPSNLDVQVKAAEALFELGNPQKAMELLRRVLEKNPEHRDTHRLLADYFHRQGLEEEANQHRRFLMP